MKLILAVIQGEDAGATTQALNEAGIPVTRLQSSGGFLRQGNATLLIAIDAGRVDAAIEIIKSNSRERSQLMNPVVPAIEPAEFMVPYPVEVQVGGASIFILDIERYERV